MSNQTDNKLGTNTSPKNNSNNPKKVLRVALIANTAWYLFNFRQNLIRSLVEAGFDVLTIGPRDPYVPRLEALGATFEELRVKPLSVNPISEFASFVRLANIFRRSKPDFVLSFTIKGNLYTGLCRSIFGFRQIANVSGLGQVFENSGVINTFVRFLYRFALSGAERIFFQNNEDLEFCVSHGLVSHEKSERISGSGVDLERFHPSKANPIDSVRRFLMFGRLVPSKGYNEYLRAARSLKATYGDKIEFLIMGMVDENRPESIALFENIKQAEGSGFIRYLAPSDDVVPFLHSATAVVLPSYYNEGVPRSLLEAIACGKPIVTTDWKGCRETVIDSKNGFLIPVQDHDSLTRALDRLYNLPVSELARMGHASRELAEEIFDEKKVIRAYLKRIADQNHDQYVLSL